MSSVLFIGCKELVNTRSPNDCLLHTGNSDVRMRSFLVKYVECLKGYCKDGVMAGGGQIQMDRDAVLYKALRDAGSLLKYGRAACMFSGQSYE